MKKSQFNLLKLANRFSNKYALDGSAIKEEVQKSIQTAVGNASTQPTSGIMPFVEMLQKDSATMYFHVTRDGENITVSVPNVESTLPNVDPAKVAEMTAKYAGLPNQVKKYLERYLELYPTKRNGEPVSYSNLTVTLQYPS